MRLFYLPKVDLLVEIALERPVSHFPLQSTETVWPSLSPFPERMERKLEDEEVAFFSPQPPSRSSKGLHDNIFLPHVSSGPLREIGALFVLSFFHSCTYSAKKLCHICYRDWGERDQCHMCPKRRKKKREKGRGWILIWLLYRKERKAESAVFLWYRAGFAEETIQKW